MLRIIDYIFVDYFNNVNIFVLKFIQAANKMSHFIQNKCSQDKDEETLHSGILKHHLLWKEELEII